MPVTFACACGKKYSATDEAVGKPMKCKACGATMRIPARRPPSSKATPAVVKKTSVAVPAVPDLDFADTGPAKPKAQDLFQGPPPAEGGKPVTERRGPAAAIYGQPPQAKPEEKKAAGLVPWLVLLGIAVVLAGVLKFVVLT